MNKEAEIKKIKAEVESQYGSRGERIPMEDLLRPMMLMAIIQEGIGQGNSVRKSVELLMGNHEV